MLCQQSRHDAKALYQEHCFMLLYQDLVFSWLCADSTSVFFHWAARNALSANQTVEKVTVNQLC